MNAKSSKWIAKTNEWIAKSNRWMLKAGGVAAAVVLAAAEMPTGGSPGC
jgi:hypothetical protein